MSVGATRVGGRRSGDARISTVCGARYDAYETGGARMTIVLAIDALKRFGGVGAAVSIAVRWIGDSVRRKCTCTKAAVYG